MDLVHLKACCGLFVILDELLPHQNILVAEVGRDGRFDAFVADEQNSSNQTAARCAHEDSSAETFEAFIRIDLCGTGSQAEGSMTIGHEPRLDYIDRIGQETR
jgi:hypothetical protein